MKIKDEIITIMDQPEAMQEDKNKDNWNQEEMTEAAVEMINLDSDLKSSGASTNVSPPDSDSDSDSDRPLESRPLDLEKYRHRSATEV